MTTRHDFIAASAFAASSLSTVPSALGQTAAPSAPAGTPAAMRRMISEVSEPLRNFGGFGERRDEAPAAGDDTSLIYRYFFSRAQSLRCWPGSCDE
jgi:hypothetical protein